MSLGKGMRDLCQMMFSSRRSIFAALLVAGFCLSTRRRGGSRSPDHPTYRRTLPRCHDAHPAGCDAWGRYGQPHPARYSPRSNVGRQIRGFGSKRRRGLALPTHQARHFVDIELDKPNLDQACYGHPGLAAGEPASRGPANACIVDKIVEFADELASPKNRA